MIILYFLRTHRCWRLYYHLLQIFNNYAYFVRSLSLEFFWMIVHIIMMHIWYWSNMTHISHYLPTLYHPSIVRCFKCDSTVGINPYLLTPIIFISAHFQPSIIWHFIDIADDDIPDRVILVVWVVSIIYYLRQNLVVVDICAPLYVRPYPMLNGSVY